MGCACHVTTLPTLPTLRLCRPQRMRAHGLGTQPRPFKELGNENRDEEEHHSQEDPDAHRTSRSHDEGGGGREVVE